MNYTVQLKGSIHAYYDEFEALATMLESFVATKRASSQPTMCRPCTVERYEWVSKEVLTSRSNLSHSDMAMFVAKGSWLKKSSLGKFDLVHCSSKERVCHATLEDEDDFIYMYETAFIDLVKKAPFAMDNRPLPLYWRLSNKFKGLSIGQPLTSDKASLCLLDELPRGMSCRELVAASFFLQPITLLKGKMVNKREYDLSTLIKKLASVFKARLEAAEAEVAGAKEASTAPSNAARPKEEASEPRPTRPSPTDSAAAKRKATPSTKETAQNNGKAIAQPSSQPTSWVVPLPAATPMPKVAAPIGPTVAAPELPPNGLPCFVALSGVGSL
ncbi:hypothetical protein CR513_03052, partial [Mucuna pruriens]